MVLTVYGDLYPPDIGCCNIIDGSALIHPRLFSGDPGDFQELIFTYKALTYKARETWRVNSLKRTPDYLYLTNEILHFDVQTCPFHSHGVICMSWQHQWKTSYLGLVLVEFGE